MCGRFTLAFPKKLEAHFARYRFPAVAPRYNVAPAQPVVALANTGTNEAEEMLWGIGGHINARSESVSSKPSFRDAARRRRAIVFADGYYEWRAMGDGKQPYYVRRPDGAPFAFAALWAEEMPLGADVGRAVTLMTRDAAPSVRAIHDRMPVILARDDCERWLVRGELESEAIAQILEGAVVDFESYPVSLAVNKVSNDDPRMIEPVAPPQQGTLF
jgi:putative SOS response-associated peptidase YedK